MAPDRIKPRNRGENRATESPYSAAYGYKQIPIERRLLQMDASDRDGQFALYRQIPSLREYLLVSQSRIQAELYTRGPDHRWTLTDYTRLEDLIVLESLGCSLCLADLYDKAELATL